MTKEQFDEITSQFPAVWKYSALDLLHVWKNAGHVSGRALQEAAVEMAGQTGGYATRPRPSDLVKRAIDADRPAPAQRPSDEEYSSGCASRKAWELVMRYVVSLCKAKGREERQAIAAKYVAEGPAIWPEAGEAHWRKVKEQFGLVKVHDKTEAKDPANW